MSERVHRATSGLAGRLSHLLGDLFTQADGAMANSREFLDSFAETAKASAVTWGEADADEPLDRLARKLKLTRTEIDLLLLAGMPEQHEGFASVFRAVHPRSEPRPSVGLAAQLLFGDNRAGFAASIATSTVIRTGAVRATGEGPLFERSLQPAGALWPVLLGVDVWPDTFPLWPLPPAMEGIETWLKAEDAVRAATAISRGVAATVLVAADSEDMAFERALALAASTGRKVTGVTVTLPADSELLQAVRLHCLARGSVAVLRITLPENPASHDAPWFDGYPDTVVFATRAGVTTLHGLRPLVTVFAERLSPPARRRMWTEALPELSKQAPVLAARYPIEPYVAREVAADLYCLRELEPGPITLEDVAEGIRARASMALSGGVKLIRPRATWQSLVLPADREKQLREAVSRLAQQATVLDDWGFLKDRNGARGVRMLFSGPSGTGKTLSAEVLANELAVDLLLVDISRVVSKWIGETEKNLSSIFDAAERAQAVLFFDEADALFGKRTEVSDAHDRYANLETAYLLARLERFEGLAILATNLRQNIDSAFLRRMEFVVSYDEPDCEQRLRLWNCHIPGPDVLDGDVNLYEMAALYPVVGGLIRNASVAAAFQAAAEGSRISQVHFLRAVRREYQKAGRAFPGIPAGVGKI